MDLSGRYGKVSTTVSCLCSSDNSRGGAIPLRQGHAGRCVRVVLHSRQALSLRPLPRRDRDHRGPPHSVLLVFKTRAPRSRPVAASYALSDDLSDSNELDFTTVQRKKHPPPRSAHPSDKYVVPPPAGISLIIFRRKRKPKTRPPRPRTPLQRFCPPRLRPQNRPSRLTTPQRAGGGYLSLTWPRNGGVKSELSLGGVLKEIPVEEVKEDLHSQNFPVQSVRRTLNQFREPLDLVLVSGIAEANNKAMKTEKDHTSYHLGCMRSPKRAPNTRPHRPRRAERPRARSQIRLATPEQQRVSAASSPRQSQISHPPRMS
ncbi:hypothetical protein EVAR_93824_1 [Eumeta japonica]|uniref:Pre-C2HC domain-containing protein n=1 Tax=Eumeta variegata TaxID=151549 RepID=A0A4C1TWM2_EUMVA|nr:hypothetical protein EVAR_93824_1 [Eumeta japonica]